MSDWSIAIAGSCGPFSRPSSPTGSAERVTATGGGWLPKVAMMLPIFASIVFRVVTTLVMRWPVMSWKLQAS